MHTLEIDQLGDHYWVVSDSAAGLTAYGSTREGALTRLKEMYADWVAEYALRLYRGSGPGL